MAKGITWLPTIVLTGILAVAVWSAPTSPLAEEEALRRLVTVRNKMILLPDLLREVGKQTGVTLTCGRELANDKLTVFVKEKPAVELLGHVATILMGEWRKTKDGYLLVQTAQARKWEEELLAWERENRLQDARKTVETYMKQSQRNYAELVREVRQQREAREAGRPPDVLVTPTGERIRVVGPVRSPGEDDYADLHNYLLGRVLSGFTPAQWQAFWQGETFVAATFDLPGALRLPPETLQWLREGVQLELPFEDDQPAQLERRRLLSEAESTQQVLLLFALDEEAGSVRTEIVRFMPSIPLTRTFGSVGGAVMHADRKPLHQLEEHPCLKHWSQWQTPVDKVASTEWLKTEIVPDENKPEPVSEYHGIPFSRQTPFTLAEYLQWLSEHVTVPIVADAYRKVWNQYESIPFHVPGETVADWLKRMMAPKVHEAWWRAEGDWLLVKHSDFWRLRHTELPENTLRQIERRIAQEQFAALLDDYAALAATMTKAQQRRMEMPGGYALRFATHFVFRDLPFLRFWGTLNRAQKTAALRDGFLSLELLPRSQQQSLVRCALEAMLGWFGTIVTPFEGMAEPPGAGLSVSMVTAKRYEVLGIRSATNFATREEAEQVIEDSRRVGDPNKEYRIVEREMVECHYEWVLHPQLRLRSRLILTPLLASD